VIREMLRRHRLRYAAGALLLLATNGLSVLIPLLLRDAVEALRQQPELARAGRFALLIIAVASMQAAVRIGSRLAMLGASRRVAYELRNHLFAHLQKLPAAFYSRTTAGDLLSRAVNDMMSIRSFFGPGIMNLINTVIIYVAALALMTRISPALTAAALLPLPLILISVQQVSRRLYVRSRAVQERLASLSERVQENLSGIRLVKTYAREEHESWSFEALCAAYRSENLALARVRGVLVPLMGSLGGASLLIAVWVGGRQVASGDITLGEFVAFAAYLGLLVWPTVAMGWVINMFQRGLVAMRRLRDILEIPHESDSDGVDPTICELHGDIEFRRLTVAHEDDRSPALRDFSLRIEAGQTVALVGPVGSGKSTVAEVLPRFIRVPDGTVFIDGHDINRVPLAVLRQSIGYAPQEAFLFSRSLRENIAFALEESADDAVEWAARRAGLDRDLEGFPEGLETRVGEGGLTLSGGQRQRAALARAVIRAPRILILDDSLSSVDAETEQQILSGLGALTRQRTTLLISHRLAAVARADRIVVLRDGRVVEAGSYRELMAMGGLFAEMSRRQILEHELEQQA
jgi:ATP-binding cassette subfamily B protein